MIDPDDAGALLRQEAGEISGPTTRVEDPLASDIAEEPEQGRIDHPFPIHVPAGAVPRGPPPGCGVPTRPGAFLRDRLQRLHPKRPSVPEVGARAHAVLRPLPRGVELPRMAAVELEAVQGGVPLGPPRTVHPVVVGPTPERFVRRPILRCAIEAEQMLG